MVRAWCYDLILVFLMVSKCSECDFVWKEGLLVVANSDLTSTFRFDLLDKEDVATVKKVFAGSSTRLAAGLVDSALRYD